MTTVATEITGSNLGFKVQQIRSSLLMTPRTLAELAGVSEREVYLYERGLPVCLGARCKMLKTLLRLKANG